MISSALRPRTVSEIVDAAFAILRAHYAHFVLAAAIAYVPWLVLQVALLGDPREMLSAPGMNLVWTLVGGMISFAMLSSVLVTCASQAYLGEVVDVAAAVRRAAARFPQVMAASLLRGLLFMLGLVALLLPAIYVVARWFAIVPAVVLEGQGPLAAMRRSSELSVGRKRHVLNTLGLVYLIYYVLSIGVGLAAMITQSYVVHAVIGAAFTVLVYPLVSIAGTLLYYDARIRSEGLDIELMADALDGAGAAPAS